MTDLELLAPARNLETGIAAITHGADAVYIGASQFGAREKAGNSLDDIKRLVDFAHQYHARVYVTVNTILYDNELDAAQQLIADLYRVQADAVIIQDMAILAMDIPPIALHASTQMHNDLPQKLQFLEQCGINRIVLPRELNLSDIARFRESTKAELECFIHGALCVCYSGQCYLSHATMGRSANRGVCSQLCRTQYSLVDEDDNYLVRNRYLMSLKDLNLSDYLNDLVNVGVTSFKIEGRLKDTAYVKNITAYYSNLLNDLVATRKGFRRQSSGRCFYTFTPDPDRSFNRGFSAHFINGRQKGLSSFSTPKSMGKPLGRVVACGNGWIEVDTNDAVHCNDGLCYFDANDELQGFLVNDVQGNRLFGLRDVSMPVVGEAVFRNSDHQFEQLLKGQSAQRLIDVRIAVAQTPDGLQFTATDADGISAKHLIERQFDLAQKPAQAVANLKAQLAKSGGSIFSIAEIDTSHYNTPMFIPVAVANEARRVLLDALLRQRVAQHVLVRRDMTQKPAAFYTNSLDYKGNVANAMSRKFLQSLGVESIAPAFEIEQPKKPCQLMVSKYCIKFELGLCMRYHGAAPTKQLYIEDNAHRYKLEFDCGQCLMRITDIIPRKKHLLRVNDNTAEHKPKLRRL